MDTLEDLYQLLNESIMEEPPLAMKEGGIIKDGYDADGGYATTGKKQKERTGLHSWKRKSERRLAFGI